MRKIFPVLVIILLASQLQAQYKPVLFGLRAGGNICWIKPDVQDYSSEGIRAGFTWGFIGEFYVMENYAILTGFNMNFIGGKLQYPWQMEIIDGVDTNMVTGDLHRQYSLKYIEIPLCLKMKASVSDKIALFGKIGLGTSFCLGAKATDNFSYEGGEISTDKTNIDDEIALMKESLIVGGGVELKIKGSTALIFELTYDNAFNNILTGSNAALPAGTEPKAVQNFVELGAGIVF
jgi:hypothetical protein